MTWEKWLRTPLEMPQGIVTSNTSFRIGLDLDLNLLMLVIS